MKAIKYTKLVKLWYQNFVSCSGEPVIEDEAESFYNAGFDDALGAMCNRLRDSGVPVETIQEVYSRIDPKGESFTYGMIMEDWMEESVA